MSLKKILDNCNRGLRVILIWKTVLFLVFFLWWDSRSWTYLGRFTKKNQLIRERIRARWLTAKLVQLGSAFIKLGQLLSARPDVLPSGWVVELADLQDKVPAFDFAKAEEVIKQEYKDYRHYNIFLKIPALQMNNDETGEIKQIFKLIKSCL